MRVNIGFVSHSAELSGAERYLLSAIDVLKEVGVRPSVAVPRRGPLCDRLAGLDVPCSIIPYHWWAVRHHRSPLVRAVRHPVSIMGGVRIARYFSSQKCHVVFTNSEMIYSGALASRLLGLPHVWQLHELRDEWCFDFGDRLTSKYMRQTTHRFIANSYSTRDSYLPYLGRSEMSVVYPSVHFTDCIPPNVRKRGPRFRCVLVATIAPHKQQVEAIEAIRHLRDSGFSVSLDLIGEDAADTKWYRRDLERRIVEANLENAVRFLGYVEDPAALMAAADVLLVTSRESFGKTIAEAMSVGTPVVGSGCGAALELIDHDETGLLYDPGDSVQLADRIRGLGEDRDEGRRLVTAARESAAKRFSSQAFRDGLMEAIESVI